MNTLVNIDYSQNKDLKFISDNWNLANIENHIMFVCPRCNTLWVSEYCGKCNLMSKSQAELMGYK